MRSSLPVRRVLAAAAALPLLVVGAAACGADDTAPVAADTASESPSVDAAAERDAADAAADDAGDGAGDGAGDDADGEDAAEGGEDPSEGEPAGGSRSDDGAGEGSWDAETLVPATVAAMAEQESSRFTMTTSGGGTDVAAEGVMSYGDDGQDMAMTMSGATLGAESMEMRVVDGVVYLSMPPMTPKGRFLEIRPDDQGSPFAGMLDQMQVDPRESMEAFEEGLRAVEFLGEESVDGESLERYRLTVDFAAAAEAQGMPRMQGAPKTVEYDLWVDEDALMRRMEMDMMQVSVVMEMSEWGEPVTVKAPARRQIVRAPGSAGS